jgi:Flp pilus assembly protein TadG
MRSSQRLPGQSGQALVEWAASAFVLLLFALGILAVGEVIQEYRVVRESATQAAFAAARAPSPQVAQEAGGRAAIEALQGTQVEGATVNVGVGGFRRGGTVMASVKGYVSLGSFPIVSQLLGDRFPLKSEARALIEPYRSRSQ